MNLFRNLFTSSIGRKILMAVTGLVLVGFVTGHLVGNLQIFLKPDHINGYAHFLQSLGPALWLVRIVLLVCVVIIFLFTGQLLHFPVTQLVSILFIATMGVLIAGLLYFLFEIRIASRTLRVARHVLKRET